MQFDALLAQVVHALHGAAAVLAQFHDGAGELGGRQDGRGDDRLVDLGDLALGELRGVVDADLGAVLGDHRVDDVGGRGDQVEAELALEALADDLQVQQAQEAAAEPESEGGGGLRFEGEGGVVELEALQGVAQVREVRAVHRVDAGEHHGVGVAVAVERLLGAFDGRGDGVAHPRLAHVLHTGDQVADLARADALAGRGLGRDDADLQQFVGGARRHHAHALAGPQGAVDDAHVGDDAPVRVVHGVEDHGPSRRTGVAHGGGDDLDDAVEQRLHALPGLARHQQHLVLVDADELGDLVGVLLGLGAGQVDLVEDGDDGEVVLQGQVEVRQSLGLDALGRVDEQDGALARRQGARHLVGEVHVAGRVDHVERVGLVAHRPRHAHRLGLDGDAPLALDVHPVQVLVAHLPLGDHPGELQHAVGQGRLPVVDVRDDAEVADAAGIGAGGADERLEGGRGDGHVYLRQNFLLMVASAPRIR